MPYFLITCPDLSGSYFDPAKIKQYESLFDAVQTEEGWTEEFLQHLYDDVKITSGFFEIAIDKDSYYSDNKTFFMHIRKDDSIITKFRDIIKIDKIEDPDIYYKDLQRQINELKTIIENLRSSI